MSEQGIQRWIEAVRREINVVADPVSEFLRADGVAVLISGVFAGMALGFCVSASDMPQWYIVLLTIFAFKITTGYSKCTVSYWECKLRGVKRDRGVVDALVNGPLSVTLPMWRVLACLFTAACWWYFLFIRGQRLRA